MYDWLEEFTDEVKLAHPMKLKAIAEAKITTHKMSSKVLADLLRANLIPEAHVGSLHSRRAKNVLRHRMRKDANVATARRIASLVYRVLKQERGYEIRQRRRR